MPSFDEEPDYEMEMKREFDKLRKQLGDAVARAERLEKERIDTRELERDHQHLSAFVDDTARALADFTALEAAGTCDKPHEALVRDLRDAAARLAIARIKR